MNFTFLLLADNIVGDITFLNKFAKQLLDYDKISKITFIVPENNVKYVDKKFNIHIWDTKTLLDKKEIDIFFKSIKYINTNVLFVSGLPQKHGEYNQYYLLDLFNNKKTKIYNFMYDNTPWNEFSYNYLKKFYDHFPFEYIYTCPIATPSKVNFKDIHFWSSYPTKTVIDKSKITNFKKNLNIEGNEKIIFFSISNWTKQSYYQSEKYYSTIIEYLIEEFSKLKVKNHFICISKENYLKKFNGIYKNTNFISYDLLSTEEYETILLSSNLVINDNARQSTMVKANSAYIPTILFKSEKIFSNNQTDSKFEKYINKLRNENTYILINGLQTIENTVKNETYYSLLNIIELFDNNFSNKISDLLFNRSFILENIDKQKRYFLNLSNLPKAYEIIYN